MSSFPPPPSPPPPPPPMQPPGHGPGSTPISALTDPPPPVATKKSGLPTWAWIVAVVALLGGGAVALFTLGGDDDKKAGTGTTIVLGGEDTIDATGNTTGNTTGDDPQNTTAATTPTGITGSRDEPVPVGQVADIGADWRLQVLDVIPDAGEQMAAADEFYDAPPAGSTYMLVRIALGYFGTEDPKIGFEPDIDVFGQSGVSLDDFCLATVPDEIDFFNYLFSGGVVVGNVCFVAPVSEAGTFQLYGKGDFFDEEGVYLELAAPGSAVQPMAALVGPQPDAASTPARLAPAPLGTPTDVGSDWQVTVTGAVRDITAEVLAENQFNETPPPGFVFAGVDLTFTYNGAGGAAPAQVSIGSVGADNVQHEGYCGIVPGEIDLYTDLFAGGSASGTMCLVVPEGIGTIALFATADFNGFIWFATS